MGEGRFFEPVRLFSDVSERIGEPWLRRAFELAESGRGTTSPNPLVGCVIVRDGHVVGEGFHERAGLPHAEIVALECAGEAARGATVYVTLEPCTHHGRTPPCTDALIAAGVARVLVGMRDPNTSVTGGGADVLRAAGVEVGLADDPVPFEVQNEAWLACLDSDRPFTRVKLGLSLDGHSALRTGERASITGESGAEVTSALRAAADAVLVGVATVTCDDPALTVRDPDGVLRARQPLRVVVARESAPPVTARVFTDGASRTLFLAPTPLTEGARTALPHAVEVAEYDGERGIGGALRSLREVGVIDLLVEPGPRLFTSLWTEGLVDELVVVQAGGVAGPDAPAAFLAGATMEGELHPALSHLMAPVESGLHGDVAVTTWRPQDRRREAATADAEITREQSKQTAIGSTGR